MHDDIRGSRSVRPYGLLAHPPSCIHTSRACTRYPVQQFGSMMLNLDAIEVTLGSRLIGRTGMSRPSESWVVSPPLVWLHSSFQRDNSSWLLRPVVIARNPAQPLRARDVQHGHGMWILYGATATAWYVGGHGIHIRVRGNRNEIGTPKRV